MTQIYFAFNSFYNTYKVLFEAVQGTHFLYMYKSIPRECLQTVDT